MHLLLLLLQTIMYYATHMNVQCFNYIANNDITTTIRKHNNGYVTYLWCIYMHMYLWCCPRQIGANTYKPYIDGFC